MKQALLTATTTIALLIIVYFGYKYFKEKAELKEYMETSLNASIDTKWREVKRLSEGTTYNIDSLQRLVFDSTENGYGRLGILGYAEDSIEAKFPERKP